MAVVYDVSCAQCGESLDLSEFELDSDNDLSLSAAPCERCIRENRGQAHAEGQEQGYRNGYSDGYDTASEGGAA